MWQQLHLPFITTLEARVSEFDEKAAMTAAEFEPNIDCISDFVDGARWQHSQLSARVAELEERVAFYYEQRDNMQQAALELGPKIDELQQKLAVAEKALEFIASPNPAIIGMPDSEMVVVFVQAERAREALAEIRKARLG
jgi:chromosome condensin MukBEF ATPase and DNA-binding subunit MukB